MRNGRLISSAFIIVAAVCFAAGYALSQDKQDKDKSGGAMPGMNDEMMKNWMQASAPGPHHKAMEAMAGNFKYVNKFKMDPKQDWTTVEGEYTGSMELGGRYLFFAVHGPMMGSQFEGRGCLGYDNTLQKHVSGWVDNMGTGIMRSEGTCDGACKTITFAGEEMDPMTKKRTKYKQVYEIKSPDEFTMRWWAPSMTDGEMFESMTITFTRVK